ncbi:MAG: dehydrogenase E1 component subunit alpha/beta [Terriglobales bacterium]|jgi:2-oxoisovalerate dehydrogenase E1 component
MATTKVDPKLNESNLAKKARVYEGLTSQQLIDAYRTMFTSRRVDDREILLKRQQKVFFQISGAGHEAMGVAAAFALKSGYDWFYPYYRDRALCLALGATPYEMLLGAVGAADDPCSGGRQMPSHWAYKRLNVVTQSSATGTQILQAVGCAEAGRYLAKHPKACQKTGGDYRQFKDVQFQGDEITYVSLGDGTTSEGEFWEALNTASNRRLPVIFCVEDNQYAISVPVEVQTSGGNISRLVSGFPNFHFEEIDGTDPVVAYAAFERSVKHCRAGDGPAFVHAHVIRPYSHSLSDDERLYRPDAERRADAARDPVHSLQLFLLREGILDEKGINKIEKEVEEQIQADADRALEAALPQPETIYHYVYSPDLDPTSAAFETHPAIAVVESATDGKKSTSPNKTMADLINATLRDEMRRDEGVIIFGEDVADASREQYLKQKLIKGKGGVFKLTSGLQMEFGADRVFNSPLAEANIIGRATGMATRGLKPVVEIQFFDYIWPAMMQLRDELPLIRWRSNNAFSAPVVVRVAIGGYLTGGAIYHSQCGESIFTHTPGLRVVFPSNALDAAGLLRTAIRCDDPVLFLEHKRLYRETYGRAPYPGPEYMIPFGKAKIVQPGTDLTVITYGAVVPRALQAAQKLEREHRVSVELIDLRCLNPFDWDAIAASVKKTNRALIAYEDSLSWGYGAEIAARIADQLFHHLDAPVKRIAATDTFVAYQPILENAILPQASDLFRAMKELAEF